MPPSPMAVPIPCDRSENDCHLLPSVNWAKLPSTSIVGFVVDGLRLVHFWCHRDPLWLDWVSTSSPAVGGRLPMATCSVSQAY